MDRAFRDRHEAGRFLASRLSSYADRRDVLVLALPRGGVPVGFEIARALHAPLDIFLVRKLGVPGHEELAMGALASGPAGGVRVLNRSVIDQLGIPTAVIDRVAAEEGQELLRRERAYRGGHAMPSLRGRTIILVDDGLATGATMHAAADAVRQEQAQHITVAVPVASAETCAAFRSLVDDVVCAMTPPDFQAVGQWYEDFSQTTDEEVTALLHQVWQQTEKMEPQSAGQRSTGP